MEDKSVGRKIEVKVPSRVSVSDLHYLLKEGKSEEFFKIKSERIRKWKEDRYRICTSCGKKKLRIMFVGQSKKCNFCKTHTKKNSAKLRREYFKEYIRKDGLQNWCAKQIVYNLKKMGLLIKSDCYCGSKITYAHHCDYNKPWEVIWLCSKHHVEWHKNNKPKYVGK